MSGSLVMAKRNRPKRTYFGTYDREKDHIVNDLTLQDEIAVSRLYVAGDITGACKIAGRKKSWLYVLAAMKGWNKVRHASSLNKWGCEQHRKISRSREELFRRWPVVDKWVQLTLVDKRTYGATFVHMRAAPNVSSGRIELTHGRTVRRLPIPSITHRKVLAEEADGVEFRKFRWTWADMAHTARRLYVLVDE